MSALFGFGCFALGVAFAFALDAVVDYFANEAAGRKYRRLWREP